MQTHKTEFPPCSTTYMTPVLWKPIESHYGPAGQISSLGPTGLSISAPLGICIIPELYQLNHARTQIQFSACHARTKSSSQHARVVVLLRVLVSCTPRKQKQGIPPGNSCPPGSPFSNSFYSKHGPKPNPWIYQSNTMHLNPLPYLNTCIRSPSPVSMQFTKAYI